MGVLLTQFSKMKVFLVISSLLLVTGWVTRRTSKEPLISSYLTYVLNILTLPIVRQIYQHFGPSLDPSCSRSITATFVMTERSAPTLRSAPTTISVRHN